MNISFGSQSISSSSRRASGPPPIIVSIIFLLIGGVALYFGTITLFDAFTSMRWPTVQGVITVSNFSTDSDSDGTTYSADIAYDYTFNGETITGSTVWFGGNYSSSDASGARRVVNRYPVGKAVVVYYDPADPYKSVLEPGAKLSSYAIAFFGLLFLIFGLFAGIARLKKKSTPLPETMIPPATPPEA